MSLAERIPKERGRVSSQHSAPYGFQVEGTETAGKGAPRSSPNCGAGHGFGNSKRSGPRAADPRPISSTSISSRSDMRLRTTVRIRGFRKIYCSCHGAQFQGHGTTRVAAKIVFSFCSACWRDRRPECNEAMKRIAGK